MIPIKDLTPGVKNPNACPVRGGKRCQQRLNACINGRLTVEGRVYCWEKRPSEGSEALVLHGPEIYFSPTALKAFGLPESPTIESLVRRLR